MVLQWCGVQVCCVCTYWQKTGVSAQLSKYKHSHPITKQARSDELYMTLYMQCWPCSVRMWCHALFNYLSLPAPFPLAPLPKHFQRRGKMDVFMTTLKEGDCQRKQSNSEVRTNEWLSNPRQKTGLSHDMCTYLSCSSVAHAPRPLHWIRSGRCRPCYHLTWHKRTNRFKTLN